LYSALPSFVLGFHGCDQSVAETVLSGSQQLLLSRNKYDWLDEGIYFWENSPARAMQYATLLRDHPRKDGPRIREPAVVGAIIDPGFCLNLLDAESLDTVRRAYDGFVRVLRRTDVQMPRNRRVGVRRELLLRDLVCAVINFIHQTREQEGLRAFDTVRAAFIEGEPLYPNSGFYSRNHIQICVRNPENIKGYFRPMDEPGLIG
jgi:hypothetical protein